MGGAKRTTLRGFVITTYKCNGVYVTEVTDKYCKRVDDRVSFTQRDANFTHDKKVQKYKAIA